MTITKKLQLLRRRQVPRSWLEPMVSLPHLFMDWPPDVSARRFFWGWGMMKVHRLKHTSILWSWICITPRHILLAGMHYYIIDISLDLILLTHSSELWSAYLTSACSFSIGLLSLYESFRSFGLNFLDRMQAGMVACGVPLWHVAAGLELHRTRPGAWSIGESALE